MSRRPFFFIAVAVGATLLFSWGVAANIIYPGSIPGEWEWAYRQLNVVPKLWLPIAVFLMFLIALFVIVRLFGSEKLTRRKEILSIGAIFLFSFLIQISVFSLGRYAFRELPIIMVNDSQTAYLFDAVKITNMSHFIRNFPSLIPQLQGAHSSTHPPGPILFFWAVKELVAANPLLRDSLLTVGKYLHINYEYLASIDALIKDPDIYATSLLSGFLIALLSAFTVFPLYYLGKELGSRRLGLYSAIFFASVPSVVLFMPQMDQVFALLSVSTLVVFLVGLRKNNLLWVFASALVFDLSIFLSFAFLALLPILAIFAVFVMLDTRERDFRFLLKTAAIFLTGVALFYFGANFLLSLDMIEVFRGVLVSLNSCILERTYSKWAVFNLYDFFSFLGIPLFLLFVKSSVPAVRGVFHRAVRQKSFLVYAFLITLFLLEILGKNRGETARLWLFLVPFAVMIAAAGFEDLGNVRNEGDQKQRYREGSFFSIAVLLSLQFVQLLVFKAYLTTIYVPDLPFYRPF